MPNIGDTVIRGELRPGAFASVQPIRGDQFVIEVVAVDPYGSYTPHQRVTAKVYKVSVPFAERLTQLDPPVRVSFSTSQVAAIYVD